MFLMASLAAAALGAVPKSDPASWISADDYPESLIVSDTEGSVGIELQIDEHGVPTACRVLSSSGATALDDLTCTLLLSRARFSAAQDGRGRAVRSSYTQRVSWQIPREALVTQGFKMMFPVSSDGKLTGCELVKYGNWEDPDLNCDAQGVDLIAGRVLPHPLTSYRSVGLMLAMEVERSAIAIPRKDGDDKAVLARAIVDVSGAGVITGCTTDISTAWMGRAADLCAGLMQVGGRDFEADPDGKPRKATVSFEIFGTPN